MYREKRHLDLVIELPGHQPLVIENKAFSLPDDDQLQRYGTAVAALPGAPTLVLLSLSDPGWPDGKFASEGREWHWLSYGELGRRLNGVMLHGDFDREVMLHEAQLLTHLHELLDAVGVKSGLDWFQLPDEVVATLERANIADAVGKARAGTK